jgi:mutator protein MutT
MASQVAECVQVAVAVVWRRVRYDGNSIIEVLAARRHTNAIRGGLWELPGGKIEPGESPEAAARREVEEETGIRVSVVEKLGNVDEADTLRGEASVRLHAVLAQVHSTIEAKPIGSAECRWIRLDEFDRYQWPPANAALNHLLTRELRAREHLA